MKLTSSISRILGLSLVWLLTNCNNLESAKQHILNQKTPDQLRSEIPVMSVSSRKRFGRIMKKFANQSTLSTGELAKRIGLELLGSPYVSGTLGGSPETLRANLDSLDCVTFVDQTIVLARCIKSGDTTVNGFLKNLKKFRYRNGTIQDITSRLHYTSDLLSENIKNNTWTDITKEIGGVKFPLTVHAYHLNKGIRAFDSDLGDKMLEIEKSINARTYYYVPVAKVKNSLPKIKDGDILMLTASGHNLDINHLGIALHKNGVMYFIHASSAGGKVMVSRGTLLQYLKVNTTDTGLMVARLK